VRLAVAAEETARTLAVRRSQRLLEMTERRALALQLVVAVGVVAVAQAPQQEEPEPVRVLTTQQQRTALVGTLLVMLTAQQTQATVLKEPKQAVRVVELVVPVSL
jgi:hypothetical protein